MAAANQERYAALREADPDAYIASLYLPEPVRETALLLHACRAEIETIALRIREPVAGEIRLQWWREVFEGSREHGGHPLAGDVIERLERANLPRQPLVDLCEAHLFDLYQDPMPGRQALEAWCGHTQSGPLQLIALAGGSAPGRALADACGHGGVARAIARLARLSGWHRSRGQCFLPGDMLAATGLDAVAFIEAPWDARHAAALDAFVALGRDHLGKAVEAMSGLARAERQFLLPVATAAGSFRLVLRAGPALFDAVPELSPLRRNAAIGWSALSGRLAVR